MRVQVCGPNLRDQSKGEFHVHADGCADLRNYGPGKRLGGEEPWALDVTDRLGVVGEVYDWIPDEEAAAYLGEFHFAPCCAALLDLATQDAMDDIAADAGPDFIS